jgi:hypothetical protein
VGVAVLVVVVVERVLCVCGHLCPSLLDNHIMYHRRVLAEDDEGCIWRQNHVLVNASSS